MPSPSPNSRNINWGNASCSPTRRAGAMSRLSSPIAVNRRIISSLLQLFWSVNKMSWSNEQIILAYRSQSQVESAFADMKDHHFLSWEPMFHWTDSKIRVHAFYCVLALILGSLLQRRAAQNGLSLSLQALFKALNGIQEVTNVFPPAGKPGSPGRPH